MKHSLIYLIFLWLVMGLAGCTAQLEPAYEPVVIIPTQDTATSVTLSAGVTQPPPALVHVTTQPTRPINTATPVNTKTATATPTTILPTTPARETPTNVVTAVPLTSPTAQFTQTIAITATVPTTNTLPNAQTPTPGWHFYVSDPHGLTMQIPAHWQPVPDHPYGLDGDDGFMRLYATDSQDNLLLNACQDMALAFGTLALSGAEGAVPIEWLTVAGQEACLVTTDDGRVAALVVRFPEPRANIVPGVAYHFLVLQADPAHMPGFVQTLYFMPVVPALTP